MSKPRAPEIITEPACATEVAAAAAGVTTDQARAMFRALIKEGFAVVPVEPTNSMFAAYMEALHSPPITHRSMIHNVGKARKRWKAMAEAGLKVAFLKLKATGD